MRAIHIILLLLIYINSFTQTTVVGHVFAEIVESIEVKSHLVTDLIIENKTEDVNLGYVENNSPVLYNVLLSGVDFKKDKTFETFSIDDTNHSDLGMKYTYNNLELKQYKAGINVVLAFN